MERAFGIWTVFVALSVSVIAAYYSIVGLTALFAAAVIPVIIMAGALEVAKITSAVYLHWRWEKTPILTKSYLTCAIVILMFITSMGIFGFLSRAHIEQSANGGELGARIERVEQEIVRQENAITRATSTISSFGDQVNAADSSIQDRIAAQERLIEGIQTRTERGVAAQQSIIDGELGLLSPKTQELTRIEGLQQSIRTAQSRDDITELQRLVGANPDGVLGPNTQRRIAETTQELQQRRTQLLDEIEILRNTDNPRVLAARDEIVRLQTAANSEIQQAQAAINQFRDQQLTITTVDNTARIQEQEQLITSAREEIDKLFEEKFELETELRKVEVEVGPVKYIAELVYGETSPELLEQAVRWVIIILVIVFDPLAVVLILAGIAMLRDTEARPTLKAAQPTPTLEPVSPTPDPTPEAAQSTPAPSTPNLEPDTPSSISITRRPKNS